MKRIKYKTIKHRDYLSYLIPEDWINDCGDEDGIVTVYNENGIGALTMSFYSILYDPGSLISFVGRIERETAKQGHMTLNDHGIIFIRKNGQHVSARDGSLDDGSFVKLWVIAKGHRFIVATYIYTKKTKEYKIMDEIVESISLEC